MKYEDLLSGEAKHKHHEEGSFLARNQRKKHGGTIISWKSIAVNLRTDGGGAAGPHARNDREWKGQPRATIKCRTNLSVSVKKGESQV